ncbi:type I addiction module toxin, SymE family [Hymenobacter sp. BRD128]|uniref:SymE family type I addiction module toxin n=1 Tax=Hymenobacter sp. BRD128 TaxID=2675878 RepID=UPI001562F8A8|nr:SymE family type I addiction module toxin [Hymenobacter sp. BRD128]QKG55229.1 type I addiction module toxin, SymE family [Hymenobacter sp. BRD128]
MAQHTARRLKVAQHFRSLHPRLSTTSKLTLAGDWLAAAGFLPGAFAVVEVQAGRLIITTAPVH